MKNAYLTHLAIIPRTWACSVLLTFVLISHPVWAKDSSHGVSQALTLKNMHLSLMQLSQTIEARIDKMKLIAKSIANDTHIQAWVNDDFPEDQVNLLVEKLGFYVKEYDLTSASFADKKSHKYWNHEGFLRVLQTGIDTWYFAYLKSMQQDLISVYHDQNKKRVDVYVNYQQLNGNGLSGIATSFDGVVEMLNTSEFAKQGDVYLVDSSGKVQVHANSAIAGSVNINTLFGEQAVSKVMHEQQTSFIETSEQMFLGASYIPSMGWYVVVSIKQP
ncbi:chemotaxis protein [Glaciecola sp. SC05]|uniref:PDC sensor domain-containing protein n=1 Tax=Glaciecola sp. SC05 TaxID=1987355 RepID=UPI003527EBEE